MKILVTGASGQLGRELVQIFSESRIELLSATRIQLDITNYDQVKNYLSQYLPDWVINCAAYTNVDLAEKNTVLSHQVNAHGPENLAKICDGLGLKLLHISTNSVFASNFVKYFYTNDLTNPINQYSKSKAEGEELVMSGHSRNYWIIRTSWLYGNYGGSFVHNILRKIQTKELISVVNDQFAQPTNSRDLAIYIKNFIQKPENPGVYHYANLGYASRFDLAQQIFRHQQANDSLLMSVETVFQKDVAARPKYSLISLENSVIQNEIELFPWQESLGLFLTEKNREL